MPVAYSKSKPVEYVLESDRELPEDQRTVFLIAVLDAQQYQEVTKIAVKVLNGSVDVLATFIDEMMKVIGIGVVGWRNFKKEDGTDVRFEKGAKALSKALVPLHLQELCLAVIEKNQLTRQDRKNSK